MPTKLVADCSTGIVEEVELTNEEIAEREAFALQYQAELEAQKEIGKAKAALKASAKAKLVAGEPLTEEEAAAIVL